MIIVRAIFGRIGNQLPYRKACDYCATFGRIGKFSYSIGKCVTIVLLLAQLVMIHLPSLAPPHFMISNFCQLRDANKITNFGTN